MGINDILAAIDNMKRVGSRNIADLGRDPMGALSKIASNVKEQLGTEEGAKEFLYNSMTPGVGGIIKSKGGNWLTGSVEKALDPLKKLHAPYGNPYSQDQIDFIKANPSAAALNNWIEGPLTKYVKRDMATEGDPVRKLAEQGVLHFTPETGFNSRVVGMRQREGYPGMGVAKAPLAQSWEGLADLQLSPRKVEEQLRAEYPFNGEAMPWLNKLLPDETIYTPGSLGKRATEVPRDLGFNHLTDELSNALNPESGLPRHLQLTPEQMQQLGMEKAVRHVADINAWRAAQQAEANLAKSQSPAVHMVREYAENNPKGLRWTELRQPDTIDFNPTVGQTTSGKWVLRDEQGLLKGKEFSSEQEAIDSLSAAEKRRYLADQLKYEGDTMGHCVGGYCDDVASGKSRIFSLRDAKGEPHVTIETAPGDVAGKIRALPDEERYALAQEVKDKHFGGVMPGRSDEDRYFKMIDNAFLEKSGGSLPFDIKQIKGKQNRKPNDEYLSFVQDFVKNHPEGGQWGDVGDLQNTGLVKHPTGKYISDVEANALANRHFDNTFGGNKPGADENAFQYYNRISRYDDEMLSDTDKAFRDDWKAGNFADGGLVHNYQPEPQWQPFAGGYILR